MPKLKKEIDIKQEIVPDTNEFKKGLKKTKVTEEVAEEKVKKVAVKKTSKPAEDNVKVTEGRLSDLVDDETVEKLKKDDNGDPRTKTPAWLQYRMGSRLISNAQYSQAIAELDKAAALDKNKEIWEIHNSKGFALMKMGKYNEAIVEYNEALKIKPRAVTVWANKGMAYSLSGLFSDAFESFEIALSIEPNNLDVLNGKAVTYQKLFKYKEALDVLEYMLKVNPKRIDTLMSIGTTLQKLKLYDKAMIYFDKVISFDKKYIPAWNSKGVVYSFMGDTDKALESFNHILKIDKTAFVAHVSIGYVYQAQEQYLIALEHYEKAKKMNLGRYSHNIWDGKASCLTKLGRFDEALNTYKEIINHEQGTKKFGAERSYRFVERLISKGAKPLQN